MPIDRSTVHAQFRARVSSLKIFDLNLDSLRKQSHYMVGQDTQVFVF
jgi:hypothetical protein